MQLIDKDFIVSPIPEEIEKNAKKISFSGTHSCGKTTSTYLYTSYLKLKYSNKSITCLNELAKHSPLKINKETSEMSQMWIYTNQMAKEIEYVSNYDLVISDRPVFDAIAYTRVAGFDLLADRMLELSKSFIHTYDAIIFKTIKNNDYLFEDGVRDHSDLDFRQNVENELTSIYNYLKKCGCEFNLFVV